MAAYKMLAVLGAFAVSAPIAYSLTKKKYRYITLLLLSLLFIFYVSRGGIIFLLSDVAVLYICGFAMNRADESCDFTGLEKSEKKRIKAMIKKRKKVILCLYLFFALGLLFLLKYMKMFTGASAIPALSSIAVPMGISYYTLQSIGYLIDVYRSKYRAETNILKLGLFVCFLPQLHEGPFGRYDLLIAPMTEGSSVNSKNLFRGISQILFGLFKILMIANRAAMIADNIFTNYEDYSGYIVFTGGIMFVIQLYAEFSGYIDIARGISQFFGIALSENFNLPFLAENIADFWRRWHISLGTWFRDYVFYPVSTSKWMTKSAGRMPKAASDFTVITASLFIVWLLTGIWHGASYKYAVYGLYYFVLMVIHNLLSPYADKLALAIGISKDTAFMKVLRIAITQFFVIIGMILFRARNLTVFAGIITSLFASGEKFHLFEIIDVKDLIVFAISMGVLLICAVMKIKGFSLYAKYEIQHIWLQYIICFSAACLILIFGAYGLDYLPPDPIYGGF